MNIPAGTIAKLDVKSLAHMSQLDSNGNRFAGSYGVVATNGEHGGRSKLLISYLVYSADQSDYVGYPASPCNFEDDLTFFLGLSALGSNIFDSMELATWNDGTQSQQAASVSSVSNPSVATLNGSQVTLDSSLPIGQITEEDFFFTEDQIMSDCSVIAVTFVFSIEFEVAFTHSKTDFGNLGTNVTVAPDGTKQCFLTNWCTPFPQPPACDPNVTFQHPLIVGGATSCSPFYDSTWFAERTKGTATWNCFPLLPGENSTRSTNSALLPCTQ